MTKSSKISKKKRGTTLKIRGGTGTIITEEITSVTKEEFDKAKGTLCALSFTPLLGGLLQEAITEKDDDNSCIKKDTIEKIAKEIKEITNRSRTSRQIIGMTSKGNSLTKERDTVNDYKTRLNTLRTEITDRKSIGEINELNTTHHFIPEECNEIRTKIMTSKRTACLKQKKSFDNLTTLDDELLKCLPRITILIIKLGETTNVTIKDTIKECKVFLGTYEPKLVQYTTKHTDYTGKILKYKASYPT